MSTRLHLYERKPVPAKAVLWQNPEDMSQAEEIRALVNEYRQDAEFMVRHMARGTGEFRSELRIDMRGGVHLALAPGDWLVYENESFGIMRHEDFLRTFQPKDD